MWIQLVANAARGGRFASVFGSMDICNVCWCHTICARSSHVHTYMCCRIAEMFHMLLPLKKQQTLTLYAEPSICCKQRLWSALRCNLFWCQALCVCWGALRHTGKLCSCRIHWLPDFATVRGTLQGCATHSFGKFMCLNTIKQQHLSKQLQTKSNYNTFHN